MSFSIDSLPVHPGLEHADYLAIVSVASAFTFLDFALGRLLGDRAKSEAIASQCFAIASSFGGAYGYLTFPDDHVDPLLGRYGYSHRMFLFAAGWFIYDTANCVGLFGRTYSYACKSWLPRSLVGAKRKPNQLNVKLTEFAKFFHIDIMHGVVCLCVFLLALSPFVHRAGLFVLTYELSTVVLNFVHFTPREYARLRLSLKAVFALTFFFVRLILGSAFSYRFLSLIWERKSEMGNFVVFALTAVNLSMQTLNLYWMVEIIMKALSTVQGEKQASGKGKKAKGD